MNDMSKPEWSKQEVAMAAVATDELAAIEGGVTDFGPDGCATMWPKDPRTGLPQRPRRPADWLFGVTS